MVAHERAGVDREVHDERRALEARLDEVLPELLDELAVGRQLDLDAGCLGQLLEIRRRVVCGVTSTPAAAHSDSYIGSRVPLAAEVVLGAVGPGDDVRAGDRDRGVLDQLLGQVGHLVVVAVRLVGLEHRELGAVRRVGALVAEVAVDLEHPLDAADDGALEEQLGRDPQEQLGVERVRVGRRTAARDAPPWIVCSIGVSTSR